MRFPRWRVFTWVILAINVIFLIWVITGISGANCAPNDAACQAGTGIGVALVIGLWVAVDAILGLLWLITKPKGRDCPVCGSFVKTGKTVCRKCGYDFAAAAGAA